MRPVILKLQAFGPFPAALEIDFTRLAETSLYGIYGPTGSGKTSVLDAVAFALFGESSGKERQHSHLRSHLALPDVETFVSLVFGLGEKTYFIYRRPAQKLVKVQKKDGQEREINRAAEVKLFDVTGLDIRDIGLEKGQEAGKLLESKTAGTRKRIECLLGCNFDQFSQIVILPQGKFREFLNAKNDDRSKILRQLFNVSLYERLEERLKDLSAEGKKSLQEVAGRIEALLEGEGVATDQDLKTALEELAREKEATVQHWQKADQEARKVREAFTQAEQLAKNMHEKAELEKERQALLVNRQKMEQHKQQLACIARARQVEPFWLQLENAQKALQQNQKAMEGAELTLQKANQAFADAEAGKDTWTILPDKIAVLKQQRTEQLKLVPALKALEDKRQQLVLAERELKVAEKDLSLKQQQTDQLEKETAKAQAQRETLAQAGLELANAKTRQQKLVNVLEKLKRREKISEDLAKLKRRMQKLQENLPRQQQALEACVAERDVIRNLLDYSAAVKLAEGLKSGEACPVCGSHDHPVLAQVEDGEDGLEGEASEKDLQEDLEKAETRYNKLYAGKYAAANELKQLEEDEQNIALQLEELETEMKAGNILEETLETVGAEKQQLAVRIREWEHQIKAGEASAQAEQALLEQKQQLASQLEKARNRLNTARMNVQSLTDAIDFQTKALPDPSLTITKVEAEAGRLSGEIEDAAKTCKDMEKSWQTLKTGKDKAIAAYNEIVRQGEQLAKSVKEAKRELEKNLALQKFSDISQCTPMLKLDEGKIRKEVEAFVNRLTRLEAKIETLARAIGNAEKPDLVVMKEQLQTVQKELARLQEAKSVQQERFTRLESVVKRLAELQQQQAELHKKHDHIAHLAEVAVGRGANSAKIGLTDWILADYFEDVLEQANLRFSHMTGGRLLLVLSKQEEVSKTRRTGLDISVYDMETNSTRSVITLSGGEGFLASLSLALGLSDVIQQESGGVHLESIFIDEGFGHLDGEALDKALDILTRLSDGRRSVGLISHVDEVKQRVPTGINIIKTGQGSRIEINQGRRGV